MEYKQVAQLTNTIYREATGQENDLVSEDLHDVVTAGDTLANVHGVEQFAKVLPDVIGRMIFDAHPYTKSALGLMTESNEYGSILAVVGEVDPEASDNEAWNPNDGDCIEENQFYKPEIYAQYWNRNVTFEIPISVSDKQVKSAFHSAAELAGFMSMRYTTVENAIKKRIRELARRVVNNQIAETVYSEVAGSSISGRSGNRAVNVLYMYNQEFGTSLTFPECLTNGAFLKYFTYLVGKYADRLTESSVLFNNAGRDKFAYDVRMILHSEVSKAMGPYALADTYNKEFISLPDAETVSYWQGTGDDFDPDNTMKVVVSTTAQGNAKTVTGVLGVMYNRPAMMISNLKQETPSNRVERAHFTNIYYQVEMGLYANDTEPFIVFYAA